MKTAMSISKLLCLTLIFSTFLLRSLSELCYYRDGEVLLQLKEGFNNPDALASWDNETDCCYWPYVECDNETGRVTSLRINEDAHLSGWISTKIGNLDYLQVLEIQNNPNLTGEMPYTIYKLSKLRILKIANCSISGSIPHLSDLKNLEILSFAHNNLNGTIPSVIGTNLTELHLNSNQFWGTVPDSLAGNNIKYINLSRNYFQGDASALFGSSKSTSHMDISRNYFQYDFSKTTFSKRLVYIDISHNMIYGELPGRLTRLNLQNFNVSHNWLSGRIPQGGELQTFDSWAYAYNRGLCDPPLPSCDSVAAM